MPTAVAQPNRRQPPRRAHRYTADCGHQTRQSDFAAVIPVQRVDEQPDQPVARIHRRAHGLKRPCPTVHTDPKLTLRIYARAMRRDQGEDERLRALAGTAGAISSPAPSAYSGSLNVKEPQALQ